VLTPAAAATPSPRLLFQEFDAPLGSIRSCRLLRLGLRAWRLGPAVTAAPPRAPVPAYAWGRGGCLGHYRQGRRGRWGLKGIADDGVTTSGGSLHSAF